ncbi:hypothetical protein [Salinarimonas ramus]|uniref:Uncharacterized protein n=1 Tax=Salinarimonas ramus TaxID=690164 RepID=A0A917Q8G2_9HYPH|nr:hypothetical protein [Salinarimonas ramus]GGK35023.1 hypothetical protein GCM10011322_22270 [Salinarimonas ramus]
MPFIELTMATVQKPRVLVNTAHVVRVEAHPHATGALVYTTPKSDGSPAIHAVETYETVKGKLRDAESLG